MSRFSEELYLEMMSIEEASYDNTVIEDAYVEAFIEDVWK